MFGDGIRRTIATVSKGLLHRAAAADQANGPLWSQAAELLECAVVHASQAARPPSSASATQAIAG